MSFHYLQSAPRWRLILIVGKSWQPSHEPPHGREKAGTRHTDKTIEQKGRDRGGETTPEQSPHV